MSEQVIKLTIWRRELNKLCLKLEICDRCKGRSEIWWLRRYVLIMEYAKEIKPNEETEDKGVKVLIDPKAIIYLLGTEMDYKKEQFFSSYSKTQVNREMWLRRVFLNLAAVIHFEFYRMWRVRNYKSLGILIQCMHRFDHQ